MLFLQLAPLETTTYMIAGFSVIFITIFIYIMTLQVRQSNLERDLEMLSRLEEQAGQ